jgi:AraC-like DNA-binding protein
MHYKILSSDSSLSFDIAQMGFVSGDNVKWPAPALRNCYVIHYVTKGKGYYNGNLIRAGQGFLIHSGQSEIHYGDPDDPWDFLYIKAFGIEIKKFFTRYSFDNKTLIFDYDFVPAVKEIADIIVSKNCSVLDAFQILEMFLHIFNHHNTTSSSNHAFKSNHEMYLDFAATYIENNLSNPITISKLASLIGITETYLYKIFTARFNRSPKQYILSRKISRAADLLIATDISITEIANSVGYDNVLTFSRLFSKKVKMSPQKYRVANQKMD